MYVHTRSVLLKIKISVQERLNLYFSSSILLYVRVSFKVPAINFNLSTIMGFFTYAYQSVVSEIRRANY